MSIAVSILSFPSILSVFTLGLSLSGLGAGSGLGTGSDSGAVTLNVYEIRFGLLTSAAASLPSSFCLAAK